MTEYHLPPPRRPEKAGRVCIDSVHLPDVMFCALARKHNHYALTNTETGAWLHRALLRLERGA